MSTSRSTTNPKSEKGDKNVQAKKGDSQGLKKRNQDLDDDDGRKKKFPKEAVRIRKVHNTCHCGGCDDGIVGLEYTPEGQEFRCRCTLCGPKDKDGNRRCLLVLNAMGVLMSKELDGRTICFDCRHDTP